MLVSGGDTPLGNSIIQKALADGFNVVATAPNMSRGKSQQRSSGTGSRGESESLMLVAWERLSPVSARNVVLKAVGAYNAIDRAVVVHSLTNERRNLHELPLNLIQEITDVQLKSHLFLAKEIISHFLKRNTGSLSLVVDVGGRQELATMDSLVTGAFMGLASSLMDSYRNDPIGINAFDSLSSDVGGYSQFIVSTPAEPGQPGKWSHYGQKSGVFRSGIRAKAKR